jgi:site-specific DNA-methyltransferase (adenine-specific)
MKLISDKSVDMILCDLPYGVTSRNKWDSIIPFEPLWEQYERVIKDNGVIVLTASQPFTSQLITSNINLFKYCWYWEKDTPTNFLNANFQPLKVIEDICVFSKGKITWAGRKNAAVYYPQGLIEVNKINRRGSSGNNYMQAGKENIQKYTNYPRNLISFKSDKEKYHPTQKPVELFEYLINTYTIENEIVLDNCMGSGTTAVACINTHRNYIGFELDKEYHKLAEERIHKIV